MNQDWDNLLILDACRFDMFRDAYAEHLDGELQSISSLGSCTLEFLEENFNDQTFHNTIYVSSNPHTRSVPEDTFHHIENLFLTHWDESHGTVHPSDMLKQSLSAHEQFPDKRMIVHFMQPHEPFIGEHSDELPQTGLEKKETEHWGDLSVWTNLRYNIEDTTIEQVTKAYRANLELVFPYVRDLVEELDGKTVITSDHGNLLGERLSPIPVRGYGHPWYIRSEPLVKVPWLTMDSETRRETKAEEPTNRAEVSEDVLEDRLSSLGYR
ncbi:alkaline phosphatase family protein [Halosimplex salinum]|uniref:hypothetical protein n=1 Tax=Halosimplex salinum TaxID=1710538 RepID=UPI0013DDA30C|nr:hypothetical protein [Halosimplex salinum]